MRLTDDIIKALHVCIEEGYESVADFAKNANVSANASIQSIAYFPASF